MQTFLDYVARDILAKHPEGLDGVALVFPNKRASLFFNQALYSAAQQPLWSPAYITISDLFRHHSTLEVPDQPLLVFKLYNLFRKHTDSQESLDQFYAWGQLMLSDFDDLDKNMADPDKLFISLEAWNEMVDFSFLSEQQRQSLEQFFGHVKDTTQLQANFHKIWRHMGAIYSEFRSRLEAEGLAYEGMLYRAVAEQSKYITFRYKHYIFVGFNLLQKVEQRLFQTLQDQGLASFYWDYDHYYLNPSSDNTANEAGRHIARYLNKFPNELSSDRISTGLDYDAIYNSMSQPKDVTYISAPTENIQARYVADWLRQNDRIAAGARTAIVLGNEKLLESVVHCLPAEVENVNITTGFPLSSSPISTLVGALVSMQLRGHAGKDGYRLKYLNPVLRHPYARFLSDDCGLLADQLNSKHLYFPDHKQLTDGYDEAIAELFMPIEERGGQLALLSWLAALLKRIGIGARQENDPLLHESIFRMYTLINRLDAIMVPVTDSFDIQTLSLDGDQRQPVSTSILQRLLSQVIQTTSIPFHGEPLLGIQIMGVLETRNLDFDHVLLLSCNEGNLPKGVNDASFIPHSLRAGYELTTVENKISIYAYYFHALLQRAGDITLTYNNATDDGQKGEMSRFMLQYMVDTAHTQQIAHATLLAGQSATLVVRRPISKNQTVMERLDDIKQLSPSAINRYLRCPLQFYYNTICHLREADNENEEEIDAMTFGNIFHRAAELIYDQLSENYAHPVTASAIDALLKDEARLDSYIDTAFAEKLFGVEDKKFKPHYNGLHMLNKKVIRIFVTQLLTLDKRLTPITFKGLEVNVYDNLTFLANGKTRTLKVGGQIDRLDEVMKDGKPVIRVVDYKTGTPLKYIPSTVADIFNADLVDKKHAAYYLQTFIYAGSVRRDKEAMAQYNKEGHGVSPALYFIRQAAATDYDPTLHFAPEPRKRIPIDDIDSYYDEFRSGLQQLLTEIFDAATPFSPTADTTRCTYCPYNHFCGI